MARWTIYFWEPSLSPHKIALVAALAASDMVERCIYITQSGLDADRSALGWTVSGSETLDMHIAPDTAAVKQIVATAPANAIHLFSGIHWVPCIVAGLAEAIKYNARFAILSEPRAIEGLMGKLRLLHSWITEAAIRRHVGFVLAIGGNGPKWFRLAGFSARKVFPFAYFLPGYVPVLSDIASRPVNIGYLGRLTSPKGFPLFLAMLDAVTTPATVEIAGSGEGEALIESVRTHSALPIAFHGIIPMPDVPVFIERLDILVVPSIVKDGWGAVISEALMAGTFVITSRFVGGAICLGDRRRGLVVDPMNVASLARAVDTVSASPWLTMPQRRYRSAWANQALTGAAGARYLLAILDHIYGDAVRPLPFYASEYDALSGQTV